MKDEKAKADRDNLIARANEAIQTANSNLSLYPAVNHIPDWHPYYWLGQKNAAEKILRDL